MKIRNLYLILFLNLIFLNIAYAQVTNSTYSYFGIGELSNNEIINNIGMGGIGIGMPTSYFINSMNPAWLPLNYLTTFQIGIQSDYRSISNENVSYTKSNAGLSQLITSIPLINNKWATSVSLLPYSKVNYNVESLIDIENSTDILVNRYTGTGGLNQFVWSHGIRLYKNFFFGGRIYYIFGSIDKLVENYIVDKSLTNVTSLFKIKHESQSVYSKLNYDIAFAYRQNISEDKILNYGMIIEFPVDLVGTNNTDLSRYTNTGTLELNAIKLNDNTALTYKLPLGIELGVSYEIANKYQIGLDFSYKNWASVSPSGEKFGNTIKLATGIQFTPDYKSVNSYFKRSNYRAGIFYKDYPYILKDMQIKEFGFNFGFSLPFSGNSLDTSFKFSALGSLENGLIRENIFQVTTGFTINDKWFIKRRFN